MKLLYVVFILMLLTSAVLANNCDYNCKPGQRFKDLCNDCTCGSDGQSAACTRKGCAKPGEPEFQCNPGEHFKNCCNDCDCGEDGSTAACTLKSC